ncbi:MAG: polysaccharide deacetylase family protein, partial [Calditrichaeota bacterium]
MSANYCARHANELAYKKCFYCHRPICKHCLLRASHHFFCSRKCHQLYLLRKRLRRVHRQTAVFRKWVRMHLRRVAPHYPLMLGILNFILIFLFFTGLHKLSRLEGMMNRHLESARAAKVSGANPSAETGKVTSGKADNRAPFFNIVSPPVGAVVSKNPVTIVGQASENYVIVLSQAHRPVQAVIPKNQVFRFNNVEANPGKNEFEVRAIDPEGNVNVIEKVSFIYKNPELAFLARDFNRGAHELKYVALTFDGGGMDNAAGQILAVLDRYHIQATMFLTGQFIRHFPEMTRRIVAAGHEVGNHTW